MTKNEKLTALQTMLSDGGETPSASVLSTYLDLAEAEILAWRYGDVGGVPEGATVPSKYDQTQVFAVLEGYTHAGGEGESHHSENGITRDFVYADMVDYIRQNVSALVRVGAVQ